MGCPCRQTCCESPHRGEGECLCSVAGCVCDPVVECLNCGDRCRCEAITRYKAGDVDASGPPSPAEVHQHVRAQRVSRPARRSA